jgi:hypothetical protein
MNRASSQLVNHLFKVPETMAPEVRASVVKGEEPVYATR